MTDSIGFSEVPRQFGSVVVGRRANELTQINGNDEEEYNKQFLVPSAAADSRAVAKTKLIHRSQLD